MKQTPEYWKRWDQQRHENAPPSQSVIRPRKPANVPEKRQKQMAKVIRVLLWNDGGRP